MKPSSSKLIRNRLAELRQKIRFARDKRSQKNLVDLILLNEKILKVVEGKS